MEKTVSLNSQSTNNVVYGVNIEQHLNDKTTRSRLHFFEKLVQTTLLRPITTTVTLTYRVVMLLTFIPVKAGLYKVSGHYTESAAYFESEYLKTVKAARDVLLIPSLMKRAFTDVVATREKFADDIKRMLSKDYLMTDSTKSFQQFSSYLHGCETFQVITPVGITEFPASTDAALQTIMASHLFKPGMMAINFGSPNVATFVTEQNEDGSVQTTKVDAKSLKREIMTFHTTNGKIQSGVFLVPTNLPNEALDRFKKAAKNLEGRADITCVNTNCRVLQDAGFSIEGVKMEDIIFPQTLMEHLLFRNVIYTDSKGDKHKVHFDIINTTKDNLEDHFEKVDTAVVGTRLRHRRRHSDTEENQRARGEAAKALIAEEAERLKVAGTVQSVNNEGLELRKVTVSVPSVLGDAVARIWGRHTIYEVDLADKQKEISDAFKGINAKNQDGETVMLRPFPHAKPSLGTRLKRDFFFSGPVISFLRRHLMGRVDVIHLHTQDIFKHLKSTKGARLNYVLLDNKVVLARVHANNNSKETHRKVADWALSKHALIANRQEVYCSGEMWYDEVKKRFMMNRDSGTYIPNQEQLKVTVELANKIFDAQKFDHLFEAVMPNDEADKVA